MTNKEMTNEEAKKIATGLRTDFKCESDTMVDFCNTVIKALEQEPCEDAVSRDAIRLKIAEMPKYINSIALTSICRLEDFLAKELEEPIEVEVTPDICRGFTIALECIGRFIKSLPSIKPKGVTITDFEWIGEKAYPICPKCNCNIIEEYISCADYAEMYKPMKFCPNCGVKIESEV